MGAALRTWTRRQWVTAGVGAVATALMIGVPTDVIPNPLFGRPVDVTWWSPLVLAFTAVLGGLVLATYVTIPVARTPLVPDAADGLTETTTLAAQASDADAPTAQGAAAGTAVNGDRPARLASVGGLLGFLAIGCPVCNKLVVVALGTTGALSWFAPIQPVLAVASVVVLAVALRIRLRGQVACPIR